MKIQPNRILTTIAALIAKKKKILRHWYQVDEVKILQPVGALAIGQVGVEPPEELPQVGAVVFRGGRREVEEGLLQSKLQNFFLLNFNDDESK